MTKPTGRRAGRPSITPGERLVPINIHITAAQLAWLRAHPGYNAIVRELLDWAMAKPGSENADDKPSDGRDG